jgi:quercetin dioxygenase-like cupin family protein
MTIHHVDWEKIEWQKVRPSLERKAFTGQNATMALHRILPGFTGMPHSHSHEQIIYILEGVVDCHIGNEVVRLGPGGLATVPPNVEHHLDLIGDKPCLDLDIFSPARPEYVV